LSRGRRHNFLSLLAQRERREKTFSFFFCKKNNTNMDKFKYYSRQNYILGDSMAKLAAATVLVCGANGLANEISKNLILAGCNVTIHDNNIMATRADVGSNCFVYESDFAESGEGPASPAQMKNRLELCAPRLQGSIPTPSLLQTPFYLGLRIDGWLQH
jgi:hypothetical protein